jgi:hypothetical protein
MGTLRRWKTLFHEISLKPITSLKCYDQGSDFIVFATYY